MRSTFVLRCIQCHVNHLTLEIGCTEPKQYVVPFVGGRTEEGSQKGKYGHGICCLFMLQWRAQRSKDFYWVEIELIRIRAPYPVSGHKQRWRGGKKAEQPDQNHHGSNCSPTLVQCLSSCEEMRPSLLRLLILELTFIFSFFMWLIM